MAQKLRAGSKFHEENKLLGYKILRCSDEGLVACAKWTRKLVVIDNFVFENFSCLRLIS